MGDQSSSIDPKELYAMLHLLHFGVQPKHALDSNLPLREVHKEIRSLGKTVHQMMGEIDYNNDGVIGFDEFKAYVKHELHKRKGTGNEGEACSEALLAQRPMVSNKEIHMPVECC